MCGFLVQAGPIDDERFMRAFKLVGHRGTRYTVKRNKGGTMAHARLPIVGVGEENDQPLRRQAFGQSHLLAFVGEILDFREIYPGEACDVNVVSRLWSRSRAKGFTDRDGFWSIAALNDDGVIELLCDYLGQKPTYYRGDVRAASSEPDALAALAPVTPDEIYFAAVIKWGYCPDVERTPYREIKHVLPGEHVLVLMNGDVVKRIADPLVPIKCTPAELRQQIEAAVRRRVVSSDVPVACLLSGGLDSSIVYTLAQRYGKVKPYYVSGTSEDDEAELAAVNRVARGVPVTIADRQEPPTPPEMLSIMQEPIDLGSLSPQIQLCRAVEEAVCLTGDGADEGFGGYGRSERYDSQASDLFHELPAWHLPRLDRVMMRIRVEIRSPFLARKVVQMAMGLPQELRTGKKILRDLFREDLPFGMADCKKIPLRTPAVARDREANTRNLVEIFRRTKWPPNVVQFPQISREPSGSLAG